MWGRRGGGQWQYGWEAMVRLARGTVDRVLARLPMDNFFRLRVVCKRWNSFVFSLGFLADCSQVSSLVSSFSLLPTSARRPTFYRLSDPAPTNAPSKKISFWDFPQGSVSLVSNFSSFFSPVPFSWFLLLLFSQLNFFSSGPSWRFFFPTTPDPPTPPPLPTRPSYYKTYLVLGLETSFSFWV